MPVRMKDIARNLGVSVVTVSKVLHNHHDISDETKQRVLAKMKELHYRPHLAARSLVTGRSFIIGLVVPDLVYSFFSEISLGMTRVLRELGYGLILTSSEEDPELEARAIEEMLARRVDAIVVASCQPSAATINSIVEQGIPYVLVDRGFDGTPSNFVGADDVRIGEMATQHLVDIGRQRIAHIAHPQVSTSFRRMEGYKNVLARNRIMPVGQYLVSVAHGAEAADRNGYEAMKILLRSKPRPDAVFCFNDPAAYGAMQAILEAGLRIPEDIAIIGCGNLRYSEYLRIPLSSVDQSSQRLGEEAARLALAVVKSGHPPEPQTVLIEPRLVIRDSTLPTANTPVRAVTSQREK